MKNYHTNILAESKFIIVIGFIFFYMIFLYDAVNNIVLESDNLVYFKAYNEGSDLRLDRFGIEVVPVLLYKIGYMMGLDYYGFNFVFGLMWLIVLFFLIKKVNIIFFPFFIFFTLDFFINQFTFLYRQYLGYFFIIIFIYLYENRSFKASRFFLLLSVLSHLSMLFFLLLSFIKLKNLYISILILFVAIIGSMTSFVSAFLIKMISLLGLLGLDDLNRKLGLIERAGAMDQASQAVVLVLLLSVFIHTFLIHKDNQKFSLLRLMYFSAVFALIFAEYKLISNRLGMPAYFFSLIYFSLVSSQFLTVYKRSILKFFGFKGSYRYGC